MRALVLFYAYDGDPEYTDPIAIIPEAVLDNGLPEEDVFGPAKRAYAADEENCRTAWVDIPDAGHLFTTPDLGAATLVRDVP